MNSPLVFVERFIDMINIKQDTLKKQNLHLVKELEQCRKRIKQYDINDKKQKEELQNLIASLNDLREEWYKLNSELRDKNNYCEQMIIEINSIKNAILSSSVKLVVKCAFRMIVWWFKNLIRNIFS